MRKNIYRQFIAQKEGGQPSRDSADAVVEQPLKSALRKPNMYLVVMLDDDYTPMGFVVHVLEIFFSMSRDTATRTMLKVHTEGRAVCGVYTRDVAETKAEQVRQYACGNEHPLQCMIEEEGEGGG